MPCDECRIDALRLDEFANELETVSCTLHGKSGCLSYLINHACIGQRRRTLHLHLLQDSLKELVGFFRVQMLSWWELLSCLLFQFRHHVDSPPWPRLQRHIVSRKLNRVFRREQELTQSTLYSSPSFVWYLVLEPPVMCCTRFDIMSSESCSTSS
jgi:hypothetical protein